MAPTGCHATSPGAGHGTGGAEELPAVARASWGPQDACARHRRPRPTLGWPSPGSGRAAGPAPGDGDARGAGTASCRLPPSRPGLRPALAPTGPRHTATCPSTPGAPTPDGKASSPPASFQKRGTMNSAFWLNFLRSASRSGLGAVRPSGLDRNTAPPVTTARTPAATDLAVVGRGASRDL